jgi:hypothetical protein
MLTEFGISQQIFIKFPNIRFQVNQSSGSRADTYGRRGGMAKQMDSFRDYANFPKNALVYRVHSDQC